jgi:signal peptidase I
MQMPAAIARLLDAKVRNARRQAKGRIKEAKKLLRRAGPSVPEEVRKQVVSEATSLSSAYNGDDVAGMDQHGEKLGGLLHTHLAAYKKPAWRESFESIAVAVLVALLLRSFVVEAFKIPSGSMIPTLAIGDQIFVNKYVYGVRVPFTSIRLVDFAMPERGEVVVFIYPQPPHEDYIKRVIGLPGDEIVVKRGVVYINGKAVPRVAKGRVTETDRDGDGAWFTFEAYAYEETLEGKTYTVLRDADVPTEHGDFSAFIVPQGEIFVMGDNRDHSSDSRTWRGVPLSNILGRSLFVWWSWGKNGLDFGRLGTWID